MRHRLRRPSRTVIAVIAVTGIVLVAAVTVALSGGDGDTMPARAPAPPAPDRPIVRGSFLERVIPAPGSGLQGAPASGAIAAAVKAMPVEDKVAQVMLLGYEGSGPTAPVLALLKERPLGGIVIRRANFQSDDQVTAIAGRATLAARKAKHDPPFIWAPQEGGAYNALPGSPPSRPPGTVGGLRDAARQATASGRALSRLNLNGVLAPVIDVGTQEGDDVLGPRAFSSDPARTAAFATAAVTAYKRAGVVSAVEHFPGLGGATQPVEDGPASVGLSLEQLRERDLVPFATAIRAGTPAIVISNAAYATDDFVTPATQSKAVSSDLLRGELRFRGVAIADDLSQAAITNGTSVAAAAVGAIGAGSDMVYISGPARGQEAAYDELLAAAKSGTIAAARLDEAVTRVLTLKREYGLVRGMRPRTKVPVVTPPAPPAGTVVPGATPPPVPPQTTPAPPTPQPAAPPVP